MAPETWEVTGPWGRIAVVVSPTDEDGHLRDEREKQRIASCLALQDNKIGYGITDVRRIA